MRFTLQVLCMHSCSFEVLRFGGATPPPPLGGELSLPDPPPPPPGGGGTVMTLGGITRGGRLHYELYKFD